MNIILIVADTFRYDALFGPNRLPVRTPNLDRFRKRSIALTRMYGGSYPTIPQRLDLTSGRVSWPWFPWQELKITTKNHLPTLLEPAGYVSQLIGDCPHVFNMGFQRGFSAWSRLRGQEGDLFFTRMNRPIRRVMPPAKTRSSLRFRKHNLPDTYTWMNHGRIYEEDRLPPRTASLAVKWLEENYLYHPFFLWVEFFDPHEPWDPPEYLVRQHDPDYRGPPMIHPNYGKASDLTAAELRNLKAHYYADAELTDRWLGRIFQKLDDLALWSKTIVVFMSDHGLCLGEHNCTGKSNINDRDDRYWPIYPVIAHTPFLISLPGVPGGRRLGTLQQSADVAPTLLELAGVRAEPPEPFHGRSFASALRGKKARAGAKNDFIVCGQYVRREGLSALEKGGEISMPGVYTKKWAYHPIGPNGRPLLFDLAADPLGKKNVIARHPRAAAGLRRTFFDWLERMEAPDEARDIFIN